MQKIFYIIIIVSLFSSCNRGIDSIFHSVESLMDERPDSAFALLNSIDVTLLGNEQSKAKYALLYSQALDKNYIDITSDSIIRTAVDFYGAKKDCNEKMLSYYYLSRIYGNDKRCLQSLYYVLEAKRIAEKLNNYYYLGLIELSIADIYNDCPNAEEELNSANNAIAAFEKTDKVSHLNWAYFYKARALYNANFHLESKVLLDSLIIIAKKHNDIALEELCNNSLYMHQVYDIGYKNKKYNQEFRQGSINSRESLMALITYYLSIENKDSINKYVNIAESVLDKQHDKLFIEHIKAKILFLDGNASQAYNLLEKTLFRLDSTYRSFQSAKLISIQSDFYKDIAVQEKKEYQREQYVMGIIIIATLLCLMLLIIIFVERIRRNRAEVDRNMEIIGNLKNQLGDNRLKLNNSDIITLFQQQFSTLDELCRTYFSLTIKDDEKTKIHDKVNSIIDNFKSDANLNSIADSIDKNHNNVICRLTECMPNLPSRERQLLLYSISGLSNKTISVLLNISEANIYNIKSRLKKRIEKLEPNLRDEILQIFI